MRLPRDLSGSNLATALKAFGYQITRQTGSHLRLTTDLGGQHSITIPAHSALRIGTLSAIISDIAEHHKMTKDEVSQKLFKDK
jgi:predicted RNA binding protein YcfA (HicA-like mRNA interferase family)